MSVTTFCWPAVGMCKINTKFTVSRESKKKRYSVSAAVSLQECPLREFRRNTVKPVLSGPVLNGRLQKSRKFLLLTTLK